MPTKVLLVNTADETVKEARELTPPDFELIVAASGSPGYARGAGGHRVPARQRQHAWTMRSIARAPKLRLVQLFSAGYDHVDLDAARRAGVPVANNGGANSRAVAEHTIMLMLAVYRRLVPQHAMTAGGRWRGNQPVPTYLRDAGQDARHHRSRHIGKRVARIAAGGFDMNVQYNDIVRMPEDEEDALNVRFRLLPELLARPISSRCTCR